jgi:hypothetical protein
MLKKILQAHLRKKIAVKIYMTLIELCVLLTIISNTTNRSCTISGRAHEMNSCLTPQVSSTPQGKLKVPRQIIANEFRYYRFEVYLIVWLFRKELYKLLSKQLKLGLIYMS